jgi:hypothetical protein
VSDRLFTVLMDDDHERLLEPRRVVEMERSSMVALSVDDLVLVPTAFIPAASERCELLPDGDLGASGVGLTGAAAPGGGGNAGPDSLPGRY